MTTTPTAQSTLLELDDRRRTSLGRIGRHSRYLVQEYEDGTILLTPAVVVAEHDLAMLADPAAQARIAAALAESKAGKVKPWAEVRAELGLDQD